MPTAKSSEAQRRRISITSVGVPMVDIPLNTPHRLQKYAESVGADSVEVVDHSGRLTGMGGWLASQKLPFFSRLQKRQHDAARSVRQLHQGYGAPPSVFAKALTKYTLKDLHDPLPLSLMIAPAVSAPSSFPESLEKWRKRVHRGHDIPAGEDPMLLVTYGDYRIFNRDDSAVSSEDLARAYPDPRMKRLIQIHPHQNWKLPEAEEERRAPELVAAHMQERCEALGFDGFCVDAHHLREWVHDEELGSDAPDKFAAELAGELTASGKVELIHFGPGRPQRDTHPMPHITTEESVHSAQQELGAVVAGDIQSTPQGEILEAIMQREQRITPLTMEIPAFSVSPYVVERLQGGTLSQTHIASKQSMFRGMFGRENVEAVLATAITNVRQFGDQIHASGRAPAL